MNINQFMTLITFMIITGKVSNTHMEDAYDKGFNKYDGYNRVETAFIMNTGSCLKFINL